MVAAILQTAVGPASLQFHLQLQFEVRRFSTTPDDICGSGRMFGARCTDNRAILDVPDLRVSIPIFEGFAVEDLRPADMIVKIDWLGLNKAMEGGGTMGF